MASQAGIRAGRAFVEIGAVDRTGVILNKVAGSLTRWANKTQAMGQNILSRLFMVSLPAAFGLNFYKNFSDVMLRVEARAAGSAKEMESLRNQARELGRTSAHSATEVGALQDKLATMGYNRREIADMTPHVANLARAAGEVDPMTDMQQSAEAVQAALRGFGLDASHTAEVVNQLAAAANVSNFTVKDLAVAMGYGSTIAHKYGVSLAEMLAIMGLWKNLGFDSSVVGTAFRNLELEGSDAASVEKFNKMLGELTGRVITFTDAAKNLKDPVNLMLEIGDAIKGLGTADQGNLMSILFGKRAVVPALALAGGGKSFDELFAAISGAKGSNIAAEMAAKMESGIGGAWRRFIHGLQDVAITISEILEPALMDLSGKLTGLLADFSTWASAHKNVIIGVVEGGLVLAAYGVTLVTVASAVKVIGLSLSLLAAAVTPVSVAVKLSNIFFIIHLARITACKVAYLAFRGAVFTIETALAALPMAFKAITTAVSITVDVLQSLWRGAVVAFKAMQGVADLVGSAAQAVALGLTLALAGAYVQQSVAALMAAAATNALTTSLAILQGVAGAIPIIALAAALTAVGAVIFLKRQTIFDVMVGTVRATQDGVNSLEQTLNNVFNFMLSRGKEIGGTLLSTFQAVNLAMQLGDTDAAWSIGLSGLEVAWLQAKDLILTGWEEISLAMMKTFRMLTSFFRDFATMLATTFTAVAAVSSPLIAGPIMRAVNGLTASAFAGDVHGGIKGAIQFYGEQADKDLAGRKGINAAAQALRQDEAEWRALFNDVFTDAALEAAGVAAENKRRRDFDPEMIPEPPPDPRAFGADLIAPSITAELKAIEGLDASLMETAKAVYEATMKELDKDAGGPMVEGLAVLKNVNAKFDVLLENVATV